MMPSASSAAAKASSVGGKTVKGPDVGSAKVSTRPAAESAAISVSKLKGVVSGALTRTSARVMACAPVGENATPAAARHAATALATRGIVWKGVGRRGREVVVGRAARAEWRTARA